MAYFHKCPYCDGNLDPGETCDCLKEAKREKAKNQTKQQANAFLQLQQCGKRGKKNGKRA